MSAIWIYRILSLVKDEGGLEQITMGSIRSVKRGGGYFRRGQSAEGAYQPVEREKIFRLTIQFKIWDSKLTGRKGIKRRGKGEGQFLAQELSVKCSPVYGSFKSVRGKRKLLGIKSTWK